MYQCRFDDVPLNPWRPMRSHTPGWKTAGIAGLEERSNAVVPIEDEKEPFLWAAMLLFLLPHSNFSRRWAFPDVHKFQPCWKGCLLLAAFPRGNFVQSRVSVENGFLFPPFPWSFLRRSFGRRTRFWTLLLRRALCRWDIVCLLSRRTFHGAERSLRWFFQVRLMRTSFFSHFLPTGSTEMVFQTKLMAFVYAAARELQLRWTRCDFSLVNGMTTVFFGVRWRWM